jgi:hypothetical protein
MDLPAFISHLFPIRNAIGTGDGFNSRGTVLTRGTTMRPLVQKNCTLVEKCGLAAIKKDGDVVDGCLEE